MCEVRASLVIITLFLRWYNSKLASLGGSGERQYFPDILAAEFRLSKDYHAFPGRHDAISGRLTFVFGMVAVIDGYRTGHHASGK